MTMKHAGKTKAQLISELEELRQRVGEESETERKFMEKALRESEEKYRSLVESSTDGIAIVQGTEVKFANQALLDMYGISREEEILGHSFISFVSHEYQDMMVQRGLDRESGKDVLSRYEFKALRQNGGEFDVEISVSPISYKGDPARQAILRDITKSKQAEDALRESEAHMKGILNAAPAGIGLVRKRELDWVSHRMCEMLGYSADELLGQSARIAYESDEEFDRVGRVKYSEIQERGVGSVETRFKRKDGSVLDVLLCSSAVDPGDLLKGTIFTALDITERKRAEEALRESEHYFRSLLFNMHEDILVIDRDYRITDVNNTLLVTAGLKYEEVIGRHCYEISHGYNEPCERKGEDCMLQEVFETGKPGNCRHQHIRTDGSKVWVDILLSPLRDENGNVTHVIEAIRDVTDLVEMEDVLRESEENFRALAENANDAILIAAGEEGVNVYANKRAAEITGYSVTELLEIDLHELVEPDQIEKAAARYKSRIAGKKAPHQYETSLVRKNGRSFPVEVTGARTFWKGQPAAIAIIRDVTKRRKAEDSLRKSEAELAAQSRHLEEVNAALRVLLKQREGDKADLEERLLTNVKELVLPYVEKLKNSRLHSDQMTLVGILESNMKEIVSPFVTKLSSRFLSLTPTEIQVASLIKDGKSSKEIASLLHASENTVRSHRFHIRSKLGIKNKKVNFRSYLQSLQD
jgi:PAS domain S-box-containing protein